MYSRVMYGLAWPLLLGKDDAGDGECCLCIVRGASLSAQLVCLRDLLSVVRDRFLPLFNASTRTRAYIHTGCARIDSHALVVSHKHPRL